MAPASVASLAANIAVDISTTYGTGLLQSFLMKKVIGTLSIKAAVAEERVLVGIARGDATITEIKAAMENSQLERDLQGQANVRVVLHETVRWLNDEGDQIVHLDVSLGGGKGIPFEDGDGWKVFAYNPDNGALSAGSQEILGVLTYFGVWL